MIRFLINNDINEYEVNSNCSSNNNGKSINKWDETLQSQFWIVVSAIIAFVFAVSYVISTFVPTDAIYFLYAVVVSALGGYLPTDLNHLALNAEQILYAKGAIFVFSLFFSQKLFKFSLIDYTSISLNYVKKNKKFRESMLYFAICISLLYVFAELSKVGMTISLVIWANEVYATSEVFGVFCMVVVLVVFALISMAMGKITGDFATAFYFHFVRLLFKWIIQVYAYRPSNTVSWSCLFPSIKYKCDLFNALRKVRYAISLKDEESHTRLILMRFNAQHFSCAGF